MPNVRFSRLPAHEARCDVLAVPVFKGGAPGPGAAEVQRALGATAKDLFAQARLKGESGDALMVPSLGKMPAGQVLFISLGERAESGPGAARRAGAVLARRTPEAARVETSVPQAIRGAPDEACAAFVEGYLLGAYRFDRYRTNGDARKGKTRTLTIAMGRGWDERAAARAAARAQVLADATNLARDLTNTPAGDKSPSSLADEARRIARGKDLSVKVFTERDLEAGGFGGILGVGRGSHKPSRMIVVRYQPRGAKTTVALVGKGITFDSGGLNLKTSGLDWMKMDMAGAAAVLGTMSAVARLKPKVAVWGILCSAENMPGPTALHPGDVLRMHSGKTVEVGDTDAEGRLVMADGIAWAVRKRVDAIADVATLTGACVVALGNRVMGVLGSPEPEVRRMLAAARRAGEPAWELPLQDDYRKALDSEIADIRNITNRNVGGGAITAGLFLKEFAGETPWVHLDVAGPARSETEEFEIPKGASGAGVRTLIEWILAR